MSALAAIALPAHVMGRTWAVFAAGGPGVSPNTNGLPGTDEAKRIVGALLTFGFIAAVAGIAISAGVWSLGSHSSNPHHVHRGKLGVVASCGAALLLGAANFLVGFFHTAGGGIS